MDSARFIEAVRARPCLYDSASEHYKDADIKTQAWADIANLLGVEERACKHKWKRLRDYYKSWLEKRGSETQQRQAGGKRVKTWALSARMEFLTPFLTPRESRPVATPDDEASGSGSVSGSQRPDEESDGACAGTTVRLLQGLDATDLFFLSMARSVKAMHPRVQAYIKLQLSALVLSAEMAGPQQASNAH